MKKFTLLLLISFLGMQLYSQSTRSARLVLHEEFTSSTCGPCVAANTKFKQWITQYPAIYTPIFYHVNWPSPGNDPMFLANTVDNGARISYYSVNSVPYAVVDGNFWKGNGGSLNIGTIQNRSNMPSPFTIQLNKRSVPTHDSIYLTMVIQATEQLTATMVAHNVVIEKNVHFSSSPGTNGETDFPNVMKKMLPSNTGTLLPASFAVGDYVIIETAWKYASVYDTAQVAAISFIQDKTTKEVYQAANSSVTVPVMPYDNDLEALTYSNVSVYNCSGKLNPVVTIRNNGNNAVSSFEVKYNVNDGPVQSFQWSGNITSLGKAVISLPEITFTPAADNVLKIFSTSPNQLADQYPKNDTLRVSIEGAPVTHTKVLINVRTDNAPEECSWKIFDAAGNQIAESDPFTQSGHVYHDTVPLSTPGCYTFMITDAGGNGLCCGNGGGLFQLVDNFGTVMHTGNTFGAKDVFEFSDDYMAAVENHEKRAMTVSPNPFHGSATVDFTLGQPGNVTCRIFDLCGKTVLTTNEGWYSAGNHQITLNADGFVPGIYVLQINSGSDVHSRRIAIK